ncbi:MAG: rod shape-determining protein MreC [Oscillospiraceae bacterium]
MKDFITKKGIYIAIAAVVIAIAAAISVALSGGNAGFASMLSQPFFKPIKSAITSMVSALENAYDYMYRFDEIKAENEELKARVAKLEEEYREYTEISEENSRLRQLLNFSEKHEDLVFEPVSVISWTASNFSSSFTISKGSDSGVELYDAVVTETGYLVGQVTEVTSASSTVTTITDTTLSVGALIYETGETGVTVGDFSLFKEGRLKLSYLGGDSNVIIGSTVVTSGDGGVYPSGLVIGYVDGVSADSSGLDSYATVTPAADINGSTHLYVVTDFAVSE